MMEDDLLKLEYRASGMCLAGLAAEPRTNHPEWTVPIVRTYLKPCSRCAAVAFLSATAPQPAGARLVPAPADLRSLRHVVLASLDGGMFLSFDAVSGNLRFAAREGGPPLCLAATRSSDEGQRESPLIVGLCGPVGPYGEAWLRLHCALMRVWLTAVTRCIFSALGRSDRQKEPESMGGEKRRHSQCGHTAVPSYCVVRRRFEHEGTPVRRWFVIRTFCRVVLDSLFSPFVTKMCCCFPTEIFHAEF